ncbi:MAG: DUF1080 domain-containing protein [Verrucomicrobiota bacterium]|jgi:hypothetical protein|nr:DUF1080 domain-containing protein [Verrucomicrobiota bacterium]
MKHSSFFAVCGLATAALLCGAPSVFAADASAFVGRWALTIPGGGAGWLGVEKQADGSLKGSILWGGGSVVPVNETKVEDDALLVIRKHGRKRDGKDVQHTETITAKLADGKLALTTRTVDDEGKETGKADFTGKKIPDLPPRPDLAKVKFGAPVPLLNGSDLSGWKAMNDKAPNCWSVADGVLSNRVKGPDGKNRHGTNIRTEAEFEDFNLKTDMRMLPGGNSGIYLRGIYEVQMADTFGRPLDPHNMGALYSRITPSSAAEKPAGEWQHVDITLVDRHLTVILNGTTIIDNQPVLGCTGGALTSDEFKPGPIYLQGDHSDVDYRNMVLTPVAK